MESILHLYQLAMVVLPVYGFVSIRKRIYYDGLSRGRAMLRYIAILSAPILIYVVINLLAIGAEELLGVSFVSEEIARTFVLAIALGLVVWIVATLVFAIGLCFLRKPVMPKTSGQTAATEGE